MNMDTGPQDVRMRVIHSKPKLWHTTGVCLQPLPLLPTFPHVCSFIHTTNNCQICWLYHSSRSDIRQWWNSPQRWGQASHRLGLSQQSGLELYRNQELYSGQCEIEAHRALWLLCTRRGGREDRGLLGLLGTHISADLVWTTYISDQVGKRQQRLYFLRKLKHAHLPHHLLTGFYWSTVEKLLIWWFTSCTGENRTDL